MDKVLVFVVFLAFSQGYDTCDGVTCPFGDECLVETFAYCPCYDEDIVCQNNGECAFDVEKEEHVCLCDGGFEGTFCENEIAEIDYEYYYGDKDYYEDTEDIEEEEEYDEPSPLLNFDMSPPREKKYRKVSKKLILYF